jgi:hypothetical protein
MKSVRFVLDPEILGEHREPRSGMWAETKRDSDQTAQQSLEAIAHSMNVSASNKQAQKSERSESPLSKSLQSLRLKQSMGDVKNWIWSFSEYPFPPSNGATLTSSIAPAGRAASMEHDWEEAVKRAYAIHAVHKHMVSFSCKQ